MKGTSASDWRSAYEAHQGEISLHMSHLTMGYLRRLYGAFGGDLALVIVLGELGHHAMVHYFSAHGLRGGVAGPLTWEAVNKIPLPSSNATAIARATGLPRETVRRKILELEARGWVERTSGRRVRITPKVSEQFVGSFNVELVESLLETTGRIQSLLHNPSRNG